MFEGGHVVGAPPPLPRVRPRGLLRSVPWKTCDEALSSDSSSGHPQLRAGRKLGMVLRRRADARARARATRMKTQRRAGTSTTDVDAVWPALPLAEWRETYETLHRWTQIVGKTRL